MSEYRESDILTRNWIRVGNCIVGIGIYRLYQYINNNLLDISLVEMFIFVYRAEKEDVCTCTHIRTHTF